MNATLVMAFILIFIVVATVITKKLPFNFVLFIAPVLCALILGHSIEETSTFIVEQLASMMKSGWIYALVCIFVFPDAYRSWCIRYDRFCYHNKTRKQDECNCYYGSDNPHRRFQYPDR